MTDSIEDFDSTARELFNSLLAKSYEVEAKEQPIHAYYTPPLEELEGIDELPLFVEEDRDILMHRDAHFGTSFPLMLECYEEEGTPAVLDIDPERIATLMQLESAVGRNLAPFILQGPDAEKVAQSRKLYKEMRLQYEKSKKSPLTKALIDLILSEDEVAIRAKRAALIGPKIVPYLLQILDTPILFDPLFPGYGLAPQAACLALGNLKEKSAVKPLFELIGTTDFEIESASLRALSEIGDASKKFCIEQLQGRPITKNNERAAILASSLTLDDDLAECILTQLEDPEVQRREQLAVYLVLALSELKKPKALRLQAIVNFLPPSVQHEVNTIITSC